MSPIPSSMPMHNHPENASIREVQAVKDELLEAMDAMENRLLAAIERASQRHQEEHAEDDRRFEALTVEADAKHRVYDSHVQSSLLEDATDAARRAGREEIA